MRTPKARPEIVTETDCEIPQSGELTSATQDPSMLEKLRKELGLLVQPPMTRAVRRKALGIRIGKIPLRPTHSDGTGRNVLSL